MQQDKQLKYVGDPFSKWVQATRKFGRNDSSTMAFGTIVSAPPNIEMRLDNEDVVYDKHDIYVAERLTAHTRIANTFSDAVTMPMSTQGYNPHTHTITSINQTGVLVEYTDELKVGDRVLVECNDETAKYTILDRVVSYV